MAFGYDSGWNKIWKPNNVLDISDFAKQLVHDLWCHYLDYGDVSCHSHFAERTRGQQSLLPTAWEDSLSKRCVDMSVSLQTLTFFLGSYYGAQH